MLTFGVVLEGGVLLSGGVSSVGAKCGGFDGGIKLGRTAGGVHGCGCCWDGGENDGPRMLASDACAMGSGWFIAPARPGMGYGL